MRAEQPPAYREIGKVVRLQIQRQSLKQPLPPHPDGVRSPQRFYDPQHILAGKELWFTDAVAAIALEDDYVLDVHAAAHPHSRNRGNGNMLSVGFTSHYDKMRGRFGGHLADGIAGENILVEANEIFTVDDLQSGLIVVTEDTGVLAFDEIIVAAPCVEFSRFCVNDRYADPPPTSRALRFLDNGTRGFYAYVTNGLPSMIRTGDVVALRQF